MVVEVHKLYVKPKPISHQNKKLKQQHNWKKSSSSPHVVSEFVSPSVILSVRNGYESRVKECYGETGNPCLEYQLREQSKRVLRKNRKPLSGILASCFSKIKKPISIVQEIKQSSRYFFKNDCDYMVVDPFNARKKYTVTDSLFLCTRRKFGLNNKVCTKLAFRPQQKN